MATWDNWQGWETPNSVAARQRALAAQRAYEDYLAGGRGVVEGTGGWGPDEGPSTQSEAPGPLPAEEFEGQVFGELARRAGVASPEEARQLYDQYIASVGGITNPGYRQFFPVDALLADPRYADKFGPEMRNWWQEASQPAREYAEAFPGMKASTFSKIMPALSVMLPFVLPNLGVALGLMSAPGAAQMMPAFADAGTAGLGQAAGSVIPQGLSSAALAEDPIGGLIRLIEANPGASSAQLDAMMRSINPAFGGGLGAGSLEAGGGVPQGGLFGRYGLGLQGNDLAVQSLLDSWGSQVSGWETLSGFDQVGDMGGAKYDQMMQRAGGAGQESSLLDRARSWAAEQLSPENITRRTLSDALEKGLDRFMGDQGPEGFGDLYRSQRERSDTGLGSSMTREEYIEWLKDQERIRAARPEVTNLQQFKDEAERQLGFSVARGGIQESSAEKEGLAQIQGISEEFDERVPEVQAKVDAEIGQLETELAQQRAGGAPSNTIEQALAELPAQAIENVQAAGTSVTPDYSQVDLVRLAEQVQAGKKRKMPRPWLGEAFTPGAEGVASSFEGEVVQ
jgi:hypothetical protein